MAIKQIIHNNNYDTTILIKVSRTNNEQE
jgi:hypothetical protein